MGNGTALLCYGLSDRGVVVSIVILLLLMLLQESRGQGVAVGGC